MEFTIDGFLEAKRLGLPHTGGQGAARTLQIYRYALGKAEELLATPLARVGSADVARLLRGLEEREYGDAVREQVLTALRGMFDWGAANALVAANPWRGVRLKHKQAKLPRILSREQVQGIFAALEELAREQAGKEHEGLARNLPHARRAEPDRKYVLFFRVQYYAGLRIGEVCRLRKQDILADGIYVHESKGGKSGFVPLRKDVLDELRTYAAAHPETDYVFYAENARIENKPLGEDVPQRVFKEAATRAGVPEATPHWLRHAAATHFLEKVGRIEVVKDFLRHADVNTTLTYAKVLQRDLKDAYGQAFEGD